MPKSTVVQTSFTNGVISPTLAGRTDVAKYYNSLKLGDNITLMPHGGFKRRAGTRPVLKSDDFSLGYAAQELYFTGKVRLEKFVFNIDQKYLIVFETNKISIIKDKLFLVSIVPTTPFTESQLAELDVTQYADTLIIVHPDFAPIRLVRGATELLWTLDVIAFKNIPLYDYTKNVVGTQEFFTGDGSEKEFILLYSKAPFSVYVNGVKKLLTTDYTYNKDARIITFIAAPTNGHIIEVRSGSSLTVQDGTDNYEPIWSATRGYPQTVTLYQGRMYFGGTKSKPITVLGSVVNDEFNFLLGDGGDDLGIFDTIRSGTFDSITNIVSGRTLQLFTESGDYYNPANPITPATSGYQRQTSYGAKRIGTVEIDGATYYVDRSGNAVRKFIFSFDEDAYVSPNIALLANHLVKDVVKMASATGVGDDVANLVFCVNGDGTMAVLNTLRLEDVQGWSTWSTAGSYKDVSVVDQDIYVLVARGGKQFIELVDESALMDHQTEIDNSDTFIKLPTSAAIDFDQLSKRGDDFFDGIATLYVDGLFLKANFPSTHNKKEIGFNFVVMAETMNINRDTTQGSLINVRKRLVRVKLVVYNTLGITVENNRIIDRQFIMDFSNQLKPYSGIKEVFLLGYADHNSIRISQLLPMPFTLLQLDTEIKY